LAAAYEKRQQWALARAPLVAFLATEPNNGRIRERLAQVLFNSGNTDAAYAELQQAAKDEPTLEPPAVTMGRFWTAKNDFKQAREWLDKAITAEPNSVRAHVVYADWLLRQKMVEEAKLHVESAAKLRPGDRVVLELQEWIRKLDKEKSGDKPGP
jgi:Tfp pilus assembly protein PilF